MNNLAKKAKPVTLIGTFLILGIGRWFNLVIINKTPPNFAVQWSIFYGLIIALIFCYLVDLALARGLLQIKLIIIKVLLIYLALVALINHFIIGDYLLKSSVPFIIETLFFLILILVLLRVDYNYNRKNSFLVDPNLTLPAKYQKSHLLKTFFQSLFRLFPDPEPIGLYKIGNPSDKSLILATGNYNLTIRRVVRELKDMDAWLLVCDSRGINIWCSTLANHFNTEKIIQAIKLVNLQEKVANKNIILPQLCAANVSLTEIKAQTGFNCRFGPIRIKDINEYLTNPNNRNIRKVTFNAGERLEMAAGAPILAIIFLVFIFNFIGLNKLWVILPAVYGLSLISALIYPYRFIKNIRIWSLFFGLGVFGLFYFIFTVILNLPVFIYNIAISSAIAYLINEFEGWSPLVKFSMSFAYQKAAITINQKACIGCGKCIEVCPKGIYDVINKKSQVVGLDECISCKSCFRQCPVGAIEQR